MSSPNLSDSEVIESYKVVTELVKKVGEIIRVKIWSKKSSEQKTSDIDLVTETDLEVEKVLISGLSEKFPSHKFIGEEATSQGQKCELTDEPTWIIDPVDGTLNFVHGYPNVCVSIALWINKSPIIGIIYNPVLQLFFSACKGKGAYLNENRIKVSQAKDLSDALVVVEMGTSRDPEKMSVVMENLSKLVPVVHGIRSSGSAALNMASVAMGSADAYYEFGLHAWDMAAGCLIVQEAGGVVIDPAGGEFDLMSRRCLCAGTEDLAQNLAAVLKQFYPERD